MAGFFPLAPPITTLEEVLDGPTSFFALLVEVLTLVGIPPFLEVVDVCDISEIVVDVSEGRFDIERCIDTGTETGAGAGAGTGAGTGTICNGFGVNTIAFSAGAIEVLKSEFKELDAPRALET